MALVVVAVSGFVTNADTVSAQGSSDDGLRVQADAVYRARPAEGVVDVEITYSVTNQVPNRTQGSQIIQTYFRSIRDAVPVAAEGLTATRSNGQALTVTPAPLEADDIAALAEIGLGAWDIDLGPNLFYGQTRDFVVRYRLVDGPPRSIDAWARVNPAFASFPVLASGDPGLSSVRVELPTGFDLETLGSPLDRRVDDTVVVLSASDIAAPLNWVAYVVAWSEEGLERSAVTVEGVDADVEVAAWPGDDEWVAFVTDGLTTGLPALEAAIGVPWPVAGQLDVVESISPNLAGYGGWYYETPELSGSDAVIEVGETLETRLLGHELAHAWFNDDLTLERWLAEGLAEVFAERFTETIDAGSFEPFEPVDRDDEAAVALVQWRQPRFVGVEETDSTEQYGYAASYQVLHGLAAEIGDDALRDAVVVLLRGENPYRRELDDPGADGVTWRDALDAFEIVGGSETAEEVFLEWVLAPSMSVRLDLRAELRAAYAELDDHPLGWRTPDLLPTLMAGWEFTEARDVIEEMNRLLDDAATVASQASSRDLDVPSGPQEAFESVATTAGDLEVVRDELEVQADALDRVLEAHDRVESDTGLLESIGLWGVDVDAMVVDAGLAFEAGDYDTAAASANDAVDRRDRAADIGRHRVLVAGGGLLGGIVLVAGAVVVVRRRRGGADEPDDAELEPIPPDDGGSGPVQPDEPEPGPSRSDDAAPPVEDGGGSDSSAPR